MTPLITYALRLVEVRAMFDDHAALVRLARRFEVRVTARGIVGKRLRSVRGERG